MKIQPLTTSQAFSRLFFRPKGSAVAGPRSFTDLFLSVVTGDKPHRPSFPSSTPAYTNPSPPLPFLPSAAVVTQPDHAPSAQDSATVTQSDPAPSAQDSAAESESPSSPSTPRMEMFPLSGPETVPPGYVPALIADLSVNSETGEVQVHFTPTTTVSEYTALHLADGVPLPSLLEQIRWQADALGISLADTPLTIVDVNLPPPFAGKSLEELSQMVLSESFYYMNPNGPYGGIGGSQAVTAEQQAEAFALIDDYVVDLAGTA